MNETRECQVLVVDDDNVFRDSMRRLLWLVGQSLPMRVQDAASGAEAMRTITQGKIDCVLLDQRMPGGTGANWIAKFLKADGNLAIVMVTGEGDEQTAVTAMKNGAMDYLVKGTITAESLQRAMANAIEKVALRQAIEQQRQMLLTAERHRVMVESLGSVCHHLGQPMTVITTYLAIMKRQETNPSLQNMINQCAEAVERVNSLLSRLQTVSTYRTEPYLETAEGAPTLYRDRILATEPTSE
jgi:FixJ family two-component response regulator